MNVLTFVCIFITVLNVKSLVDFNEFDPYDMHPKTLNIPSFEMAGDQYSNITDSEGWWQVKMSDHFAFDSIRKNKLCKDLTEILLFYSYCLKIVLRRDDTRDPNMIHSCYEYKLLSSNAAVGVILNQNTFCYPSIIITGVPKCSTSAIFALLQSLKYVYSNPIKENCPFVREISIVQYFASLPQRVGVNQFVLDGCIDIKGNMMMRKMLRQPNTFYIVMVRNFADMMWSAYNYWCDEKIEHYCPSSRWVNNEHHIRSPELFHAIVLSDKNVTIKSKKSGNDIN